MGFDPNSEFVPVAIPIGSGSADVAIGAPYEPFVFDGHTFPHKHGEAIRAMDAETRATWEKERYRAQTDPLFLSDILGLDLQTEPHAAFFARLPRIQPGKSLSELNKLKRYLLLWSRQVAKTTGVRVYICQLLLVYCNIRIAFLTGTEPLGKNQLAAIKGFFEHPTQKFAELFPEYCFVERFNKKTGEYEDIPAELGTTTEFTVPCRTNFLQPEPSFALTTEKMAQSGAHFDVIFLDDLVNNANYRTIEALEKSYDAYKHVTPLLSATGYLIVTGTRYSWGDAYERMQEERDAELKKIGHTTWKVTIHGCYSNGCRNCPHGSHFHETDRRINALGQGPCFYPGCTCGQYQDNGVRGVLCPRIISRGNGEPFGFTLQWLDEERARLGEEFFAHQYLNQPISGAQAVFTEDLLDKHTLHHKEQLPPQMESQTFCVGDLAYSSSEKDRDETVIYVYQQYRGQLFPWACYAGHWGANAQVEQVLDVLVKHRPKTLFLEKNQGWESLFNLIQIKATERHVGNLPIVWIQPSNKKGAKQRRIDNIHPLMVSGRVKLYAPMQGYDTLRNQLLKPRGRRNDYADCLGMMCECPTNFGGETLPQQPNPMDWLRKLSQSEPTQDTYYDSGLGSGLCG